MLRDERVKKHRWCFSYFCFNAARQQLAQTQEERVMANADELYRQGEAAYQAGDYAEAFEFYRQAGDMSYAQAYYKKAEMLRTGDIVLKGMDQTTLMDFIIKHYLAAAKLPNPSADAMFTLGLMLNGDLEGMRTSKPNRAEAGEWFEKAAANGHKGARDELAKLRGDSSAPAPSARSAPASQPARQTGGGSSSKGGIVPAILLGLVSAVNVNKLKENVI
jgi:TPR repeat protein